VRRNGPIGLMALLAGMMLFGAVAGAAGNVAPTRPGRRTRSPRPGRSCDQV